MKNRINLLFLGWLLLACHIGMKAQPGTDRQSLDSVATALDTISSDSLWAVGRINHCLQVRKHSLINAKECFLEGLRSPRLRQGSSEQANFLMRLGSTLELMGEYATEMEYYVAALYIFHSQADTVGISNCYNAMGNLYIALSDYAIALDYHQKALALRRKLGNEVMVAGSYNNLGNICLSQDKFPEALGYYEQARAINERDSNLEFLSSNYSNIGLVYDGMGEPQKAIEFHERALELRTRLGNQMTMTSSKIYLGFAHTHLGNHAKAIDYLEEGLKVAMDNDAKAAIQHSCLGLYQAFKAQGNYKAALEAHEKYIELEDTLRNDEMAGKVARAEMEFRGAQQKKDLALLRQNDALKAEAIRAHDLGIFTATIVAAIALLLMAMLVAVVFWLRYRSKKKSELQLERSVAERTEALLRANDELSKFIYQSSHGLRSPLTSIQGLASIAMGEAGKGEERHYIELIMGRVAHLDGVNTGLIEFMHVKERAVQLLLVPLGPLLEKVMATVALRRKNAPLHLHSQLAPDATVVADEFLLGIILQNLLLNVIDFCVVGQDPEATLELVQGNGKWELRLQDKGIGIPAQFLPKAMEMFSRGNPRSQGSGIGLYTARQAAEKMQAQLILHSVEHQGTLAIIQCESGK